MSNLSHDPAFDRADPRTIVSADVQAFAIRETRVGAIAVRRALPLRDRRLVGPWCFLDRYGPLSFTREKPMDVAPHPHIGLQTVSWLFDGEVVHHDSLKYEALVRPGDVAIMTAGRGIAHAEETPVENTGRLSGVQLWVALPDAVRNGAASFAHHRQVPLVESQAGLVRPFVGDLAGVASPGQAFTPAVGADLSIFPGQELALAIRPDFEHALLVVSGDATLEGQPLDSGYLYYLTPGRSDLALRSGTGGRVLLVGGTPFGEPVLMWWNFVARTPAEIAEARAAWERHDRFGDVVAYEGPRLTAPAFVTRPVTPR